MSALFEQGWGGEGRGGGEEGKGWEGKDKLVFQASF